MVSDAELAEAIRPGYELSRLCLSLAYFGHPMAMLSELGQAPPSDAILAALVLAMELADLLHSTGVDDVGFARYQTAAAASPPEVPDVRDRC